MEAVIAIAVVFSIVWLMVVQFFARVILFSGGGVKKPWDSLVALIGVVIGFVPLALVLYYVLGD